MSTLLLAPFNDSMRLGQGYNSFLQTPCLENAVNISNASFVESNGSDMPSQTVSYSARFVEKMSEVVRAMNISAGSSIRTGSVSVSAGGNNIDEIKFSESDLNAVISVKVINQTRNLRDNVTFKEPDIKNMDSNQFHSIYGDTFISGFIYGGDLHGIISIKAIDASKRSEVKNRLRSQFNGKKSEWSPSSSDALDEALQQSEVTVTVNWSGGGTIKPPDEEWTIESLVRASSTFADNVAKCPQRSWAILTRYDTVLDFVIWSSSLSPPVSVRRYEGVQRLTSDLLDMYIEYKGNLLILNDAIRHEDKYEESQRHDRIALRLGALIDARKELRAEMGKIVAKIERLDKDPGAISDALKDEIIAPELWRARLPFRKSIAIEAASTQNLLESLFKGLPIHAGLDKEPDLSEQLDAKELQLKLTQSEEAKEVSLKGLEEARAERVRLKDKLSAPPAKNSVAWWLRDGLCPDKQRKEMPRFIKEWADKNVEKWPDCRISYLFRGLEDIKKDGSDQFQCSLDQIGPEDQHVLKVEVFMRPKYLCGLRVYYVSNKMVEHGDCTSPIKSKTEGLAWHTESGFCLVCSSGVSGRPEMLHLVGSDTRSRLIQAPEVDGIREGSGRAPPGYFLRGFWTQYEGDGFERLGFIWGVHPSSDPSHDSWCRP